jgi:tetratricopeptide (TPR) repeat protein
VAAVLGWAVAAHGACNGPQAMVAELRAHPTAENAGTLGSWYASHQQFDCALEAFRTGLKAEPGSAALHYVTGLSLAAMKRPSEAIAELQRSIELDPQQIKPHMMLASLYDEMDKPDEAEHEWRKALAIDPRSESVLEGFTGHFMRRQDYANVVQLLGNASRTEKLDIALARALGSLNDLVHAAEVLTDAMKAHPDSVPLKQAMLVVLVKEHKHEDAIALMKSILEKHPDDLDLKVSLLQLLVLSDHVEEAKTLGPQLLTARPHDPQVLFLNGLIRHTLGDNEGARKLLEEAVVLEPDFANMRYELGNTLVLLKQWQEAREQLEKALELGADEPEVHFALGRALHGLGDEERSRQEIAKYQDMKQVGEQKLEAAEAVAQGDIELENGKPSEAVAHYREAIEGEPQIADYRYKLAIAFHRSGDTAAEQKALEEAIAVDPRLPGAQNALGYLLSRNGDPRGAAAHFRAATQAAPSWSEAWINLAAELAVTAHFSEARQAVARALELDPENAQAKELSDQLARDPAAQQDRP